MLAVALLRTFCLILQSATVVTGMDAIHNRCHDLAATVRKHVRSDGEFATAIPGVQLSRRSQAGKPIHTAVQPCLALVVQGGKTIMLGAERLTYGVGDYLLVSLDLPVVSRVVSATAAVPNLAIGIAIDADRLASVLARLELARLGTDSAGGRGVSVDRASPPLLESVARLLQLLDSPADVRALAPLYHEEILYRLVTGPSGPRLLQIARADTPANSVARATSWLRDHYAEPLRVEELARRVSMSVSSLHHHFKAVTTMSPLRFQKQLRLTEGRRLILIDQLDVGAASTRVGYQSPSQFTREYARMFGRPPRGDLEAERKRTGASARVTDSALRVAM